MVSCEKERSSEVNVVEGQLRLSAGRALPSPTISKPLLLNSKQLNVKYMKWIVALMSLPTSGSADNICQMIKGWLTEMSKEPQHVQVLVTGESGHIHLQLQDADGPFLDVEPGEEQTEKDDGSSTHNDDKCDEEQDLESALQESRELATQLQEEMSALKAQLEQERERVKEVWHNSCNQLREFDEALESKDEEITYLKSMLEGLSPEETHGMQPVSVQSNVPS